MIGQEFCQNCGDPDRCRLKTSDLEWTEHGDALCESCGALRCATGYDPITGEMYEDED